MKTTLFFFISLILIGFGQARHFQNNSYMVNGSLSPGIAGNGIICLLVRDGSVYVASDEGMAITRDNGHTWSRSLHQDGIGKGGVSALDVRNGMIWIATGFDTLTDQGLLPAGGGLGYSMDDGETWQWLPQPRDDRDEETYKPTTTHVQNITYDLAITDEAVWITSFAGGLRKSSDMGRTWKVVTVDDIPFYPLKYLSHRAFSVIYDGESLWVGTAGGVHKSTDGGLSWTTFSHQNQDLPISGNFVVALGSQRTSRRNIIWAATWPTTTESGDETEFRAVSRSEDGGLTWSVVLENESAHNFAFNDSIVYVATDNGVLMSPDYGETWAVYPPMVDEALHRTIYDTEMNTVEADASGFLWVGTSDGLGMTHDNGLTWSIFQVFVIPSEKGEPDTYACPNPFSPARDRRLRDEGHCRFVYPAERQSDIEVSIFDFGMNLVTTLEYHVISPGIQVEPVWTGRNDLGDMVANGVYFYRVRVPGEGEYWGKVMVVN